MAYEFLWKDGRIAAYRGQYGPKDEMYCLGTCAPKFVKLAYLVMLHCKNETRLFPPPHEGGRMFFRFLRVVWHCESLTEIEEIYERDFKGHPKKERKSNETASIHQQ